MILSFASTAAGKFLCTFLISITPIIELHGGLPYGIAQGLDYPLALMATILDMRLKNAIPSILLGVYIAAAIMTAVTTGIIHIL
ncbi:hypothetical protein [Oscillibacter sp. GMB15532]|uniref:hypothetical protein n=1 Tax=Oscillibacter sp. GMB15532 TaxID=3230022 RepID=UPI0034DE10AF